jgi:hypothetical protein
VLIILFFSSLTTDFRYANIFGEEIVRLGYWAAFIAIAIYAQLYWTYKNKKKIELYYLATGFFYLTTDFLRKSYFTLDTGWGLRGISHFIIIFFAVSYFLNLNAKRELLMKTSALIGIILIVLNTVPIFSWYGLINLSPEPVQRFQDNSVGILHDDPLNFGLFGLSESYFNTVTFTGRLQGWLLEPLHWGYYINFIISALLLLTRYLQPKKSVIIVISLILVVHIFFVQSLSHVLSIAFAILLAAWILVVKKNSNPIFRNALLIMPITFLILSPLVLIALNSFGVFNEHVAESLLGKEGNWTDKIDFLNKNVDLLLTSAWGSSTEVSASHNIFASTFFKYGFIISSPLYILFIWILHKVVKYDWKTVFVTCLYLSSNIFIVPDYIFSPLGVLWSSLVLFTITTFKTHALPKETVKIEIG